jgi:phage-related protein
MPKVTSNVPKTVKPYISHGVSLSYSDRSEEAIGDCPFCGKEGKFFVSLKTSQYQCKVCGTGTSKGGGNPTVFIRELWKHSETGTKDYDRLAGDRGLLFPETLIAWEAVQSSLTGEWMLPGYSPEGKQCQLYRYVAPAGSKKRMLLATPESPHGVHGVNLFDRTKRTVYVCEGPWDAMVLWEVLRSCKYDDDGQLISAGEPSSLLKDANVIAFPGCNVFHDSWGQLLADKDVVLCYDSDHFKKAPNGKDIPPAGWVGMRRICQQLSVSTSQPRSVSVLKWGEEGFDPDLKSGYDVRDHLTSGGRSLSGRIPKLRELLSRVHPIPSDWVAGRAEKSRKSGKVEVETLQCESWARVRTAWMSAMQWTADLDYALSCMLAVVASTDLPLEQLWIKVVSPASTGKTTLVEALAICKDYVYSKDTMTGLFSGFQTDVEGKEDLSMIPKINGKTLVIKDGDTILQNPAMSQILSQFRALYDRALRTQFKNKMSRDYEDINTTVILCGTSSIRKLDQSELGERFLDVVIMEEIDPSFEDDIQDRVIARMFDEQEDGDDHAEHMSNAKRLTGGYVRFLRYTAPTEWKRVHVPPWARSEVKRLALLVAHMRARPSARQHETTEREMSPRLTMQIGRLAKCLAIVLNKAEVDEDVMTRVRRCAVDTARGDTMRIATAVRESPRTEGVTSSALDVRTGIGTSKLRELIRFLVSIKVLEKFQWRDPLNLRVNAATQTRYRLTERIEEIFSTVERKNNRSKQ